MMELPKCVHGNSILQGGLRCLECLKDDRPLDMDHFEIGAHPGIRIGDTVDHPAHYNAGGIECIEAIKAALTPEEFIGFCKGNIFKYLWREKIKGGTESMKKAKWYLERILKV